MDLGESWEFAGKSRYFSPMRKTAVTFATLLFLLIEIPLTPAQAAVKAGAACSKAGLKSVVSGITYTCIKSGKKFVWDKGVAVTKSTAVATPAATPSAAPVVTPTPTPAPTPEIVYATLWEKYGWNKPSSASAVAATATKEFTSYVATVRDPNPNIEFKYEGGENPIVKKWITDSVNLEAKTFEYPKFAKTYYPVIGQTKSWYEQTLKSIGQTPQIVSSVASRFDSSGAYGGTEFITFNTKRLEPMLDLPNGVGKPGLAQTGGHEFFHTIQESLAKKGPSGGLFAPNWIWEGSAMFVGLQTSSYLGFDNYATTGRQTSIDRYTTDGPETKLKPLIDIYPTDNPKIDAYAIGEIAAEFIVANVGMSKLIGIYANLGKGNNFETAFKLSTGVPLADFYSMFEEVRVILGVPRG
ncbi:hypothetical protein DLE04_03570 [Actinobacteria bacterium IMCC26103]|nr:hypothetical protein DLE04_03570 [Actinobacteria bacterium IMCC26103]